MRFLSLIALHLSCSVASPLLGFGDSSLEVRDPQRPTIISTIPGSPKGPAGPTLNPTQPGNPGTPAPGPTLDPTSPGNPGAPAPGPTVNPTSPGGPGGGPGGGSVGGNNNVPPTLNPTLPGFPGGGPTLTQGQRPTRTLGPLPPSTPRPNPPSGPVASCAGNTANTRSQWCQYSVDTDYTSVAPNTGRTREYWLTITEVTVAPDGFSRPAMALNGTIPGPTIIGDWGDTMVIHVTNGLKTYTNGSSIHWHGVRQNYTNEHDGVPSITQCPTAPGETITYTWRATQYGTSWYHSHFSLMAWEGVHGGLIINGPATANYDEDKGTIILGDWSHATVDSLYDYAQTIGPPTMDNGLINGTNTFDGASKRFTTSFTEGKSYRLRIINSAIDTHWKFSIDNHTLQVIAADFVPIVPYTANYVNIGMGQRYDVIVTANQGSIAENFWMRAIPQSTCSSNANAADIMGIVTYGNVANPTTTGWDYVDSCDDETANLVPHFQQSVGSADLQTMEDVSIGFLGDLFKWTLNSTTLLTDWGNPTLGRVLAGDTAFNTQDNIVSLPNKDEWFYIVVQTEVGVTHPLHLHGHDFHILAQATGTYTSDVVLNVANPMRRDVAMLPANGYVVLAWKTDNPGIWLMHCHIGWHTSEGFALQFAERISEIPDITDSTFIQDQCDAWNTFKADKSVVQADSGV